MVAIGADFLKYIPRDGSDSNGTNDAGVQFAQRTWAAGGVFIDANSTAEQKAQAVSSTIQGLLALFGNNESEAARRETQANEEAANNLEKSVQTTTENVNTKVNEQIERIQEIAAKIQESLDKIEDGSEEKEEHQKKLQEYLDTIDGCKAILENPNSTSAERTAAIEKLKAASAGIAELASAIENLQHSSEEEQANVEDLGEEQTNIDAEIETIVQQGNSEIAAAESTAKAEQAKNAVTAAQGVKDETVSTAAKTAAATTRATSKASSWIPFVGTAASTAGEVIAQKLDSVASDYGTAAGQYRIPGAAATTAKISASELTMQASLTAFANIASFAIGESNDARAFSQAFYSLLEPIGSWLNQADDINTQAETLNTAVDTASQQVEEQKTEEANDGASEEDNTEQDNNSNVELHFETDDLKKLSE